MAQRTPSPPAAIDIIECSAEGAQLPATQPATSETVPCPEGGGIDYGTGRLLDTYDSAADAAADRAQQLDLLQALGASDLALRRDECGAWRVRGTHGALYTWGDGRTWYVSLDSRTDKQESYARKALRDSNAFCQHEPGWRLRLMALPTAEQAQVLRSVLGIRKRRLVSEAERERLRKQLAGAQYEGVSASRTGGNKLAGGEVPEARGGRP